MKKRPDVSLNVCDSLAPVTLLKVQVTLSGMKEGQRLEVICTDEETKVDLSNIIRNSGHKLLSFREVNKRVRFLIQKVVPARGC